MQGMKILTGRPEALPRHGKYQFLVLLLKGRRREPAGLVGQESRLIVRMGD